MQSIVRTVIHTSWTLIRIIAVISSSVVAILSSLLPVVLQTSTSYEVVFAMFIFLSFAAIVVHGALTHLFNDYADYLSGTDAYSPAILSGGSRVIQKKLMSPHTVHRLAIHLTITLLIVMFLLTFTGYVTLPFLIFVGVWAAYSYSMPPLRLSYRPFLGEGLSLFPAMFFLGLAGPWLILDTIPLWAYQNALINAFVCMAWVMVHHIPDVEADQLASPVKRTSVVWFVQKFGMTTARVPAIIYFVCALVVAFTLGIERYWNALIVMAILLYSIRLLIKMDVRNIQEVTNIEKRLLLLAIVIAIVLGIF